LKEHWNLNNKEFMKKIILPLLCLLFFSTCKKGEDDPFISLRSRKARLEGDWHLSTGKLTESVDDHKNKLRFNRVFSFTSTRYEATEDAGYYAVYKGVYMLSINMDKNGSFNFKEQFDSRELFGEGVWDFLQGSDKIKNKEEVNFIIGKLTKGSSNEYHLFNWGLTTMRYRVKELRNKTLVLTVSNDAVTDPSNADLSYSGELTFVQ